MTTDPARLLPANAHRVVPALFGILALSAFASCEDAASPADEFSVTPDAATVFVGESVQLTSLNAPTAVVQWSSSNAQVASVVPETGFVTGVGPGEATISAVAGSDVATVDVTVRRTPALAISTPTVEFDMTLGGANPPAQIVTVSNAGDGTLTGISLGAVTYGAGQPQGWLTATLGGTDAPAPITLTARAGSLPRGTYTATIAISASGVANSPQSLAINFRILAPASLNVSRTSVPMAGVPGATIVEAVDVTNGGDRPLTGLVAGITYFGQPQGWLSATLSSGQAPATLTLTATTGTLAVGSYTASVRISSAGVGVPPADIAIRLVVSPGPAIALSSTVPRLTAIQGQSAQPVTVNVTNSGGGTLSGLTLGAILYEPGQPQGWLSAALSGGTAPATITLNAQTTGLAQGTYSATLPVASPLASNSPVSMTVRLTIGPPPVIAVNPGSLTFAAFKDSPAPPGAQAVQVTNASPGDQISGLSYSVAYGGAQSGWLDVSWQSGSTTTPTTLLVRPNATNLPGGTQSATITISTSFPGVAPKTVSINYTLQTYTLNVHPLWSQATCTNCHPSRSGPDLTGNAQATYNAISPYVPVLPGKLSGSSFHSGGTFPSLLPIINAWIAAGAPFN